MDYTHFIKSLECCGWRVPNRSFATKTIENQWQLAFIRLGGRFQVNGRVCFVCCVRHTCLSDREKTRPEYFKNAFDYPFKLSFEEIGSSTLRYQSRLLNFETSTLAFSDDWTEVLHRLDEVLPSAVSSYSAAQLRSEILEYGTNGYLERIWIEDLAGRS